MCFVTNKTRRKEYETEKQISEVGGGVEQTTPHHHRDTTSLGFSPLFQTLCHQESGRHEHLYSMRTFVEE